MPTRIFSVISILLTHICCVLNKNECVQRKFCFKCISQSTILLQLARLMELEDFKKDLLDVGLNVK